MIDERKKVDYEIAEFSRESEEKRLMSSFADFLNLNEITGRKKGQEQSSLLSSERVVESDRTVEVIKDEAIRVDVDSTPLTVLAHRDENKDLRTLEIICSCGKHAVVELEYDENLDVFDDEEHHDL